MRRRGFDQDPGALTARGLDRLERADFEDYLAEQAENPSVIYVGSRWRIDGLARYGDLRPNVDLGR